jgi:hypothetical protein
MRYWLLVAVGLGALGTVGTTLRPQSPERADEAQVQAATEARLREVFQRLVENEQRRPEASAVAGPLAGR